MTAGSPGRFWAWPSELRRRGVLGINRRNLDLLAELNPRRRYPGVDDKVLTKGLCEARGVPVPRTFGVVERLGDARRFPDLVAGRPEFVVKPARGSGGRGVLVVARAEGAAYVTSSGETLAFPEIRYHLSNILSGLYSLGGRPDRAIVEERIRPHSIFERLAVGGTPDVRILVHRGRPVMAMLRLPTRASRGRANLHQGAAAAGVDLAAGRTRGGVCRNRAVDVHPDTGQPIAGLEIPRWPDMLDIAGRLGEGLEMGYIGVDLVLDERRGPLVLEANARPGLSIQIADGRGLLDAIGRSEERGVGLAAPPAARVAPP
jgi:alpha-L-glutamate ligase-like protein